MAENLKVLITGGAGYIGSHACVELLNSGYDVTVIDNLCNASEKALERVEKITNRSLSFVKGDILDFDVLHSILSKSTYCGVMHFAGLKAVGESVSEPVQYYHNNVSGTLTLLRAMQAVGLNRLIFSSSATVYGDPQYLPLTEDHPTQPTNLMAAQN
jgi:UDP-glucose 4-epimerase